MDTLTLRKEVAAVLQDVPNNSLPLFKFREMFERRYRRTVSTSDLYRMREVVHISDNCNSMGLGGRKISLSKEWTLENGETLEVSCRMHPPSAFAPGSPSMRLGWAEKEIGVNLPNVEIDFRTLSARIRLVLTSHHGSFPLFSFLDCYGAQFGGIKRSEDGVPLEHLIASVQGVEISIAENGMKRVQWKNKGDADTGYSGGTGSNGSVSCYDPMALPLAQLSRELIDLLKTLPRCSIAFAKMIPAYHHQFGRQCRVADYGHPTLSSLLQTLPNTIQVIGEGASRIITLAHKAQMRRFASDVFRVLKSQPGIKKQVRVDHFSEAFSATFPNRTFCPEDYGLCFFSDLVAELVDTFTMVTLVIGDKGEEILAIPRREQTIYELQKMQVFAAEVVELLGHSIRCEMQFSKFIPSYHHHFGRQCRVSDYGFTKLAELFEAISDTVVCEHVNASVEPNPEEKVLRLTPPEQVKVVGRQIREVVDKQLQDGLPTRVSDLEEIFLCQHGFALRVDLCGATDLLDLLNRLLCPWVKVEGDLIRSLTFEEQKRRSMTGEEIVANFGKLTFLDSEFPQLAVKEDPAERAKKLRTFAEEIRVLLEEAGGYLGIQNIDQAYSQKYGRCLNPCLLGYGTLMALLQAIPDVATLRGKFRTRRILVLNKVHNGENHGYVGHGKFGSFGNRGLENGGWNGANQCNLTQAQQSGAPPPFSPMGPSPVFRPRDTNIFNFEQPASLSSPVFDMWVGDNSAQGSPPPMSPSIVWAYHPFCYPPPPGSPNLFIPSFPFPQWNSNPSPNQPLLSQPFELEHQPQAPAQ